MIQAVIFDLNGTVLSDEDEYGKAFKEVLASLGVKVNEDYPHTSGIGVEENWEILIEKHNIETKKTKNELAHATQSEYLKLIDEIEFKKGFASFISELRDNDLRTALATSNTWEIVDKLSEKLDLVEYFDVITTREEVIFTKPDPQIFILTAKKLDLDPEECVVFEDSKAGIDAAILSGMKTVGVARNKKSAIELKKAGLIIYNYDDISVKDLLETK